MNIRLSFIFQYWTGGWSEQWYCQGTDTTAAATQFNNTFYGKFMGLRADGVLLRAIRANNVDNPRESFLNIVNIDNQVLGVTAGNTGEPGQVALLGYVTAEANRRRPLLLRGLGDQYVARDGDGKPIFSGLFLQGFAKYIQSLKSFGAQVKVLKAADANANPDRPIVSFAPSAAGAQNTLIAYNGLELSKDFPVIVHKVSRQSFPGFTGPLPLVSTAQTAVVVPVMWARPEILVPGGAARIRNAIFDYANVLDATPEDVRSKKIGRPSLSPRGRRTATRYRSR